MLRLSSLVRQLTSSPIATISTLPTTTTTTITATYSSTPLFSYKPHQHQRRRGFSTAPSPSTDDDEPSPSYSKIAFIGSGKMAEALIAPLISTNLQPPSTLSLNDLSKNTLERVSSTYNISQTSTCIAETIHDADLIVCAIKPQNCDVVFEKLRLALKEETTRMGDDDVNPTILSVVAGKPIKDFLRGCGGMVRKVARSMPNTPAQIGKGVTVWTCTENVEDIEKKKIKAILNSFGKAIYVDDENFIDMATSISGSGPAYVFMLIEAMVDAGVHMGFSRDTATTLVHQTLLGSTLYAMETGEHPAVLRNSVTSPAGTTASAMYELERGRFRTVIKDAIWSCYRRSLEMGGKSSNIGPGRSHHVVLPGGECIDEGGNGNGNGGNGN